MLCSGKIYYDLVGHEVRAGATTVAVARLEQLYPFPVDAARELTASYPNLEELVWAQEEPQNMGAWRTIRHRLEAAAPGWRPRPVRRPALAGEPERGLPDRPPARAGPDRPRGADLAPLSYGRRRRAWSRLAARSAATNRGPCVRVAFSTIRR